MSIRQHSPRRGRLAAAIVLGLAVPGAVLAQEQTAQELDQQAAPAQSTSPTAAQARTLEAVQVTGSRIKRTDIETALPVTIIQKADIEAQGITSAEQLLMQLNISSSGGDNLASNTGIASAQARGNNGVSGANLRMQGADATLVLLNGRRVSAHGLAGQVVDLNSIPFAAIERVEVLRDGASAMYGTDAIGGVINFVTKTDYQGLTLTGGADVTEEGGGNIYRASMLGGFGDLDTDRWNVWMAVSAKKNELLNGWDRDFTNSLRPERGLVPDTSGTPLANVVNGTGSLIGGGLTDPADGTTQQHINIADLPGGIGCENAGDMMGEMVGQIWNYSSRNYACSWDYGRARVLQQPQKSLQFVGRATFKVGDNHQFYAEAMGSDVESRRRFEALQITTTATPTATTLDAYPLNALTQDTYDMVYDAIVDYFGEQANLAYGSPIAYRWRCYACGSREYTTTTRSLRLMFGAEGSIGTWDYTTGLSRSSSKAESVLTDGFYYTDQLKAMLGSGLLNPFLLPGQEQSAEAKAALVAASAAGTQLYNGETSTTTFDATFSGGLGFHLWASEEVQAAVGAEWRREEYEFGGPDRWDTDKYPTSSATPGGSAWIYQAAGDATFYMPKKERTVKAAFAEFLVPVVDSLNLTLSGRYDEYSGFGGTFNPKYSFKWQPIDWLAFRGSYSTGFKVPTFAQLFRRTLESPTLGSGDDIADPATCPGGNPDPNVPGCEAIFPIRLTGGNPNLKPEESEQRSVGVVLAPTSNFNISIDWWEIERLSTIRGTNLTQLKEDYEIFQENWIRDSSGAVAYIDQRYVNTGGTLTRGIEVDANLTGELYGGNWRIHLNGNYLDTYKTKELETQPYEDIKMNTYRPSYEMLPLRWKHTLSFGWNKGDWSHTLSQVYRDGYTDYVPPGLRSGTYVPPAYDPEVDSYTTYNYSVSWSGIENLKATFGIRNLLNTDPPFTLGYLDYGGGSAWDTRVADPRGRSFNMLLEYKFE
ncbi:TonB-dependent receptor [Pseudoxanthomonas sangjuensis]|uniref:TonB-dependent receptor plug domain-containing protein n=1 Tax=Pseudoxanthomonas sangjuensis TaxID=1503750 RepID=UPI001391AAEC|nr:TonB-dependent receptor [Pseudoxanthomonas sangjuensis]